jgi:hypothetical protein
MNPAFASLFQLDAVASQGVALAVLSNGAWQQPAVYQPLLRLLDPASPAELNDLTLAAEAGPGGRPSLKLYARRLPVDASGQPAGLLLGLEEGC